MREPDDGNRTFVEVGLMLLVFSEKQEAKLSNKCDAEVNGMGGSQSHTRTTVKGSFSS